MTASPAMSEKTLRQEIIREIMTLVQPEPVEMKPKPTIDELERILSSDDNRQIDLRPDGSVWARERKTVTVGIVADAILRVIVERRPAGADPEVVEALKSAKELLIKIANERRVIGPLATAALQEVHKISAVLNPSPVDGGRG